jgi:uncharacterized Zn finger protein (UPF0148 family)
MWIDIIIIRCPRCGDVLSLQDGFYLCYTCDFIKEVEDEKTD